MNRYQKTQPKRVIKNPHEPRVMLYPEIRPIIREMSTAETVLWFRNQIVQFNNICQTLVDREEWCEAQLHALILAIEANCGDAYQNQIDSQTKSRQTPHI